MGAMLPRRGKRVYRQVSAQPSSEERLPPRDPLTKGLGFRGDLGVGTSTKGSGFLPRLAGTTSLNGSGFLPSPR